MVSLALLAACSDAPSATPTPVSPTPTPNPTITLLPGAASDPAVAAVPEMNFVPRAQDYSTGAAGLAGAKLSFNTATLAIKPGVTVGGGECSAHPARWHDRGGNQGDAH